MERELAEEEVADSSRRHIGTSGELARRGLWYRYLGGGLWAIQPGRPRASPRLTWREVMWRNHPGSEEPAWVADSQVRDEDGEGWPLQYWIIRHGRRWKLAHGLADDWEDFGTLVRAVDRAEALEADGRGENGG